MGLTLLVPPGYTLYEQHLLSTHDMQSVANVEKTL